MEHFEEIYRYCEDTMLMDICRVFIADSFEEADEYLLKLLDAVL